MKEYDLEMRLLANETMFIRDNSLEAIRVSANRNLTKHMGEDFHLQLMVYPHNILRENKMMMGAGADRLSEGMRRAFGKGMGRAAAVYPGQPILSVKTRRDKEDILRSILKIAASKVPKGAKVVTV